MKYNIMLNYSKEKTSNSSRSKVAAKLLLLLFKLIECLYCRNTKELENKYFVKSLNIIMHLYVYLLLSQLSPL